MSNLFNISTGLFMPSVDETTYIDCSALDASAYPTVPVEGVDGNLYLIDPVLPEEAPYGYLWNGTQIVAAPAQFAPSPGPDTPPSPVDVRVSQLLARLEALEAEAQAIRAELSSIV